MKSWGLWLRVALVVAIVGFIAWRIDPEEAWDALQNMHPVYLLGSVAAYGAGRAVAGLRWRLLISGYADVPMRDAVGLMHIAYFANSLLPGQIGHVVGVQVAARRYRANRAALAGSVFAAMPLTDTIAFACFGLVGLAFMGDRLPAALIVGLTLLVVALTTAAVWTARSRRRPGWGSRNVPIRWLPQQAREWAEDHTEQFIAGLSTFRDTRVALKAIGLALGMWLLTAVSLLLVGEGLGIRFSIPEWLVLTAATNVIILVPVTPSNIGPYEAAVTGLATALGAPAGAAFLLAIISHVLSILYLSVAGVVAMLLMGLRPSEVLSLRGRADD
jgi:phosphatidyl-myo-inositol alpha-mannosyltransferase